MLKKYQSKITPLEQDKEGIGSPRTSLSKLYSGTDNSSISITSNLRGVFANIRSNLHSVVTVDED